MSATTTQSTRPTVAQVIARRRPRGFRRAVVSRTNPSITWPSVAVAASAFGVQPTSIRQFIATGGLCYGHHLRYADVPEQDCPPKRSKEIPVMFRGQRFESIKLAALSINDGRSFEARCEWVRRHATRIEIGEGVRASA